MTQWNDLMTNPNRYPPLGRGRLWLARVLNLMFYWEWTPK